MVTTITLQRLMQKGYESMLSYYERVSLQFSEPLYLPAGRRVRDPYVSASWRKSLTSSGTTGEAYSIGRSFISPYFESMTSQMSCPPSPNVYESHLSPYGQIRQYLISPSVSLSQLYLVQE